MRQRSSLGICALLVCLVGTAVSDLSAVPAAAETPEIKVSSSAFSHRGMIPKQYTCDGENISPPLAWNGIPKGTKSIALVCDDSDAPRRTLVHWVLFNLPPDTTGLPEKVPARKNLTNGAVHGKTGFRRTGYGGPCPPSGTHRYFFKIYAVDSVLKLDSRAGKAELLKAMKGHILAQGELMGKYKRR